MHLILHTCAESAAIDQASNRASLFHLTEQINARSFPTALHSLVVFSMWKREPEEPDAEAQLTIKLNGESLMQAPIKINFQGAVRTRTVVNIQGLVLNEPGILDVDVNCGQIGGSWKISVEGIATAQPAPSPT